MSRESRGTMTPGKRRVEGIALATIDEFDPEGRPIVRFEGATTSHPSHAHTVVALTPADKGAFVAIAFLDGDPDRPLVLGRIVDSAALGVEAGSSTAPDATGLKGRTVVVEGDQEIVLRCGEASITLTRAGKVLIRGEYVSSRAAAVNRITGASVKIN